VVSILFSRAIAEVNHLPGETTTMGTTTSDRRNKGSLDRALRRRRDITGDSVTINLADPTDFGTPDFTVDGTAVPTDATVRGILTNKADGSTIQSGPVTCDSGDNGHWVLSFSNIPPGAYILSVVEDNPNSGADSKNVNVIAATILTLNNPSSIPATSNTATATVNNTGSSPVTVSAVISQSPQKHGRPRKQTIAGGSSADFLFSGLTSNTPFTVTAFPLRGNAQGAIGTGKTKP
jgi:hypothetical protein